MRAMRLTKNKGWIRLITFIVITTFLYSSMVLASPLDLYYKLHPRSSFKREYPPCSQLKRIGEGPLFVARPDVTIRARDKEVKWERLVYNAAAVRIDKVTYVLYRALGYDGVSRIGLWWSKDGISQKGRLNYPIFTPEAEYELPNDEVAKEREAKYGREIGGVEDPRIILVGDTLYMTYTAFGNKAQIGVVKIKVDDFLNGVNNAISLDEWKKLWEREGLMFEGVENDKDGIIFPERFSNKWVVIHRIPPGMQIVSTPTLSFSIDEVGRGETFMNPRSGMWDNHRIGAGTQPIETEYGWLQIYHGVEKKDEKQTYMLGIVLIDLKDPTRIIYRSPNAVLVPEREYEKAGWLPNVVFTCGAVPKDKDSDEILYGEDTILVYYAGADNVMCIAEAKISELIPEEIVIREKGLDNEPNFRRVGEYVSKQKDVNLNFKDKWALVSMLMGLNKVATSRDKNIILRKIEELNKDFEETSIKLEENVYEELLSNGEGICFVKIKFGEESKRRIYLNWKKLQSEQLIEIGVKDKYKKWLDVEGTENVFIVKLTESMPHSDKDVLPAEEGEGPDMSEGGEDNEKIAEYQRKKIDKDKAVRLVKVDGQYKAVSIKDGALREDIKIIEEDSRKVDTAKKMAVEMVYDYEGLNVDEDKEKLVKIIKETPLSLLLGETLVYQDNKCYFHAGRGTKGFPKQLWLGELLFYEFTAGELAFALVEEARHILHPDWSHDRIKHTERAIDVIRKAYERIKYRQNLDQLRIWERLWEAEKDNPLTEGTSEYAKQLITSGKITKKASILTLGCWHGEDEIYFAQQGCSVTATDCINGPVENLNKKAKELSLEYRLSAQEQNVISDFHFDDAQFDYIYANLTLHYFDEEQMQRIIGEIYRVLKPGGKVFLGVRSTKDYEYGKGKSIGNDMFISDDGKIQRFFTAETLSRLFIGRYTDLELEEISIGRYKDQPVSSTLYFSATKPLPEDSSKTTLFEELYSDIALAKYLLGDIFPASLDEDRIYEMRYDATRLSDSQQKLINTYIEILKGKVSNPDNIIAIPFTGVKRDYVIKVVCKDIHKQILGEGQIYIEGEDKLGNYPLRIIGMLNMAFAASNIPNNLLEKQVEEYRPIISFIQNQYKAITDNELLIPESIEEMLNVIRKIDLPKPEKMNLDEVDRLNRLAEQLLDTAA